MWKNEATKVYVFPFGRTYCLFEKSSRLNLCIVLFFVICVCVLIFLDA